MRITTTEGGEPVAAVVGWDLKITADALRCYIASGSAPRRAAALVAGLESVEGAVTLGPCTCASTDHHISDCPRRGKRRLHLA